MMLTPKQRRAAYNEMHRRRVAQLVALGVIEPETQFSPMWVQRFDRWRMS